MTVDPWFSSVTTDAAFNARISTTAKAVYLVLAVHADHTTGQCWVSNTTTAKHLGVTRLTVIRAMNQLVEAGLVRREPRYNKGQQTSNLLTLVDVEAAARKRGGRITSDTGRRIASDTRTNPRNTP